MTHSHRIPLRVMFITTYMPVGGAETLLVNLIRGMDRTRFAPELCCLKRLGPLGEVLADEIPAFTGLISRKTDVGVYGRLTRLLRQQEIDAVITVGTGGDKMFWGRLAAWRAGVPVVASAIHTTGYPDRVEWLNRRLVRITDAFIAVAESHGRFLAESEGCPAEKVRVVPNGVDVDRFRPQPSRQQLRSDLGIGPDTPVAGIVAALRPEKDHALFLRTAACVWQAIPRARFLVVGDGTERPRLEALAAKLGIADVVHFLGSRSNIPDVLSAMDVVLLTSRMEASPVSLLEAMAVERPVIATAVGSIPETVVDGVTGYLVPPGDEQQLADRLTTLLNDPWLTAKMGRAGRQRVVEHYSLEKMVEGYKSLIEQIYCSKSPLAVVAQ